MNILLYAKDMELCSFLRAETKCVLLSARQEATVLTYRERLKVLEELSQNSFLYDIVVLEIDTFNDIESLYRLFRIHNPACHIIAFDNTYQKLNSVLLFLQPTALLKKPLNSVQYAECLRFIISEYRTPGRCFKFNGKNTNNRIPLRDIEYFESNQHTVTLHTVYHTSFVFYAKLDDVQERLPANRFVRCHQSYLINLDHIQEIDRKNRRFRLTSDIYIDISRRSLTLVTEVYNRFHGEAQTDSDDMDTEYAGIVVP